MRDRVRENAVRERERERETKSVRDRVRENAVRERRRRGKERQTDRKRVWERAKRDSEGESRGVL